jgi:hypothetical protein
VSANVGSLTLSVLGWLVPFVAIAGGVALWRPAAPRLRTLSDAFAVPLTIAMAARFPERLLGQVILVQPSPDHPSQAGPHGSNSPRK